MITKEDLENALNQYRARLINSEVQIKADKYMVEVVEKMIKDMPDDDPMPEDLKKVIKGVKE